MSPMAVPKPSIKSLIDWLPSILSSRARSTLSILPRNGSIAWMRRSLPCLAEPPAESPSTINSSDSAGSLLWQSASLPGRPKPSIAPLRRTESLAALAALRALRASTALPMIERASSGLSSRKCPNASLKTVSTAPRASILPSLAFVWPSNCISRSLTETTAAKPSSTSSPVKFSSLSRSALPLRAYALSERVSAPLKPVICVPPSAV